MSDKIVDFILNISKDKKMYHKLEENVKKVFDENYESRSGF